MPVPKRKRSRARRDKRFANKGVKVRSFASCSNCSEPKVPHAACAGCGYYRGRKVLNTKSERVVKRADALKEKQGKQAAVQNKLQGTPVQEPKSE